MIDSNTLSHALKRECKYICVFVILGTRFCECKINSSVSDLSLICMHAVHQASEVWNLWLTLFKKTNSLGLNLKCLNDKINTNIIKAFILDVSYKNESWLYIFLSWKWTACAYILMSTWYWSFLYIRLQIFSTHVTSCIVLRCI